MSTYFHGISSEIQADSAAGPQTLYLMTPPNYFDQNGHHFVGGVPLPVGSASDYDLNRSSSSSSSRFNYNHLWGGGGGPATDNSSIPAGGTHQGLSLSLSYREQGLSSGTMIRAQVINGVRDDTSASNGLVMRSKYLKAAQELLDEVVNVGKGIINGDNYQVAAEGGGESERREKLGKGESGEEGSGGGESSGKRGGDQLTTAQRQELQMKKAKLVNMLDEVEQRYKEYHNQMQIVVSSFEHAAGIGSTKSYTALALQTISKQFRCLKDAISVQIKAAAGGLGEDVDGIEGYSRLKFVDHQLRQQRALQKLGMMPPPPQHHHHNAWRPQRGLPETAVSVLRAWLFEHFLHPYPKDSDKQMLAKQTGLTRSQVSNWFINARVRLWKPMVEEMYLEEMKQHDQESSTTINGKNTTREPTNKELLPGESKHHQTSSMFQSEPQLLNIPNHIYATQTKGLVLDSPRSPKKPKPSSNDDNNVNIGGGSFGAYNIINPLIGDHHHDHHQIIGVDRQFDHEQLVAAGFHDFLSNQMGMNMGSAVQTSHYGGMMSSVSPPDSSIVINGYESINSTIMNNNRKRFAAPLLPDFVT